jgi:hypothetical protein
MLLAALAFDACIESSPSSPAPSEPGTVVDHADFTQPIARITFEDAYIRPDLSLVDDGTTYPRVVDGMSLPPSIDHVPIPFEGKYVIKYEVPSGTVKERLEHKISTASDPNGLHFGSQRVTSFAFMLDAATTKIDSSALFFQEWQGYPYGPPVALKLTRASGAAFIVRLAVRNMDTGPDSDQPDNVIWTGELNAGEWYRFVISVKPGYPQTEGELRLWLNGVSEIDWTGKIGYDPEQVAGALDGFDTKFGLYQPSPNEGHSVYFDDVRFGATYESVTH